MSKLIVDKNQSAHLNKKNPSPERKKKKTEKQKKKFYFSCRIFVPNLDTHEYALHMFVCFKPIKMKIRNKNKKK